MFLKHLQCSNHMCPARKLRHLIVEYPSFPVILEWRHLSFMTSAITGILAASSIACSCEQQRRNHRSSALPSLRQKKTLVTGDSTHDVSVIRKAFTSHYVITWQPAEAQNVMLVKIDIVVQKLCSGMRRALLKQFRSKCILSLLRRYVVWPGGQLVL